MTPHSAAVQWLLLSPLAAGFIGYAAAVVHSNRQYKPWPRKRTLFWTAGMLCAALALAGPIAAWGHADFAGHMTGHLLLGMLAPLLMTLAAPMTLLLRTLPLAAARRLSRILRSRFFRIVSDPITASFLNIGGLWLLYVTDLFALMHHHFALYVFIHLHVLLAGFLFTSSFLYIDPVPHRSSFTRRSVILVIALAGHAILAKHLYAHPPTGVPAHQAEAGSMLMYYGGDAVDALLIALLCYEWYRRRAVNNLKVA